MKREVKKYDFKAYDFALRSRKELLEMNTDSYNSMSETGYLTEESRVQRKKHLAELQEEVSRIERRDEAEIRKIFEDLE